jgi:transcriptional regulator with XRE-family HTH domain
MKEDKPLMRHQIVKIIRKRLHLTMGELGKKAGVSPATLASFESGRRNLSDELRLKIQGALIEAVREAAQEEERKEREARQRKILSFTSLSGIAEDYMPELSSALEQFSIGRQQKDSRHAKAS